MPLPVMTPDEENLIVQSLGGKPGQRLKELPDGNIGIDEGGPIIDPAVLAAGQNQQVDYPTGGPVYNQGDVAQRYIEKGVVPALGAALGGVGTAALAGSLFGPLGTLGGAVAGGVGALVGGIGASVVQDKLTANDVLVQDAAMQQQWPKTALVSGMVPNLLVARPGIAPLQEAGRFIRNTAGSGLSGAIASTSPEGAKALANLGVGAGMTGGQMIYRHGFKGEPIHADELAIELASLGLMNQPGLLHMGFNKLTGKPMMDGTYKYEAASGESMMRGGLEAQPPLEMPATVTKPKYNPDAPMVTEDQPGYAEWLKAKKEYEANLEPFLAARKAAEAADRQRRAEAIKQAKIIQEGRETENALEAQRQAEEQARLDEEVNAIVAEAKSKAKQEKYDEKIAYSMAKARLQRERAARNDAVKMAKQQFAAEKKIAAGETEREILEGNTVLTEAGNRRADTLRTQPGEAARIAGEEGLTAAERIGKYEALLDPRKGGAKIPHVPDTYETVREQMNLALDPASGRKAVLFGKGQETPPVPVRLRRVTTPHGDVVYNPAKITAEEVLAAGSGQEFDARVLGMSQQTKPGEAAGVLVSGKNNAQAEVVDAEGVPAAVEAALKADESAAPELRDPETVIEDREQPPAYSNEDNTSADYDTRARETAGDAENIPRIQGMAARTLEGQGYGVDVMNTEGLYNTPDDPRPRWGKQEKNRVEFSTARADTPLHESMHAMIGQLSDKARGRLQGIVESDPAYVKAKEKNPSLSWEEHLVAEGGQQLLERVQNSEFGLWNDMVSGWRRLTGSATTGDAARKLGNMFVRGGGRKGGKVEIHTPEVKPEERTPVGGEAFPGGPTYRRYPEQESFDDGAAPKEEGSKVEDATKDNSEAKYSAPAEGVFSTDLEKQARKGGAIWGVMPDKAGGYDATQLIAKFRAQGKIEKEILPGFEEWAKGKGKVTAAEVAAYAKENEPRAQVVSYGMDREQSAAKKELDALTHEWHDNQEQKVQAGIQSYVNNRNQPEIQKRIIGYLEEENPGFDVAKLKRFVQLYDQVAREPVDNSPTATHYYNSISPRPVDRPMPDWTTTKGKRNLQRVDVVLPSNAEEPAGGTRPHGMDQQTWRNKEQNVMWREDGLHENLPNTLGWAAIQYETGPNGEKIAHVVEAQSRWGQELRRTTKTKERIEAIQARMAELDRQAKAENQKANEGRSAQGKFAISLPEEYWTLNRELQRLPRPQELPAEHPLLADYNRLILKAAIEQARKEGATHIAISDAETAMMTEMHDQTTTADNDFASTRLLANQRAEQLRSEGYRNVTVERSPGGNDWVIRFESGRPEQEPGMRFNYDGRKGQLHKIAQEITRSAGEDVSFGEHKNAWQGHHDDTRPAYEYEGATPREDLIFRNPDGTPKTTATARLYPIAEPAGRRATGEPFTYGGARYSAPNSITGFSTVQKISNPKLRKAVMNAFDEKQRFSGEFANRVVDALRPVRKVLTPEFYDKMVRAYRGQQVSFTFEQQRARRIINNEMTRTATRANKLGAKRPINITPDYVPEPISEEAIREIKNDRASVASKAIEKQLAAHFGDSALAAEYLNHIAKADYSPDHEYGPLRKAAGRGLPKGVTAGGKYIPIREPDMMVAFERYGNRVARDLAWTREVEAKGMDEKWFDENADKYARLAQHEFNGNVRADFSAGIHEGMRLASAMKLGLGTGVRNLITLPQTASRFGGKNALGTVLKAGARYVTEFGRLRNEAVNTGHLRIGQSDLAFDKSRYGSAIPDALRHMADGMQFVGQKPTEFLSRVWTRAFGEVAAEAAIREGNTELINRLGLDMKDPELRTKLAQRIAVRVEGTYDARSLPTWMIKGVAGDVMSLAKWNMEHANAWVTDILVPAKKGDVAPLVWSILAAAGITIPAKTMLDEWTRKRKGNATLSEIQAAEHVLEKDTGKPVTLTGKRVAWLTDMMNSAGILGFLGQAVNAVAQGTTGNRQGASAVMIPFAEVFGDELPRLVGDWKEAVDAGTPVEDATKALGVELLKNISQGFRMAYNQLPERQGELGQAAANRDRAVFENLTEDKAAQSVEANKLMNPKVQKFKDSVDVGESRRMLNEITADIEERFKDNPFLMRKKLMALRQLSAREIPNDQWAAGRYRDFLEETLGKAGAEKRMAEWAQRHQANKMKSDMMKGLPEPIPVLK